MHSRHAREGGHPSKLPLAVCRGRAVPIVPCVNILASGINGTLYIGVTGDLFGRIGIHKQDLVDGFPDGMACTG